MTADILISASFRFIEQAAPFMLCFTAVALCDQLIGLVRKAAAVWKERSGY